MKKNLCLLGLLMFLSFTGLFSQNSFRAVAPSAIGVGEQFRITYTIDSRNVSNYISPSFVGFEIISGPSQSSSSSISNINGIRTSTSSISFTYVLLANNEGVFEISPASISVDGNVVKSNPLKIKVSKDPSQAQRSQYQGRPQPKPSFNQNNITSLDDKSIFVKAISNRSSAVIGQEIIIAYKLYTLVPVSEFQVNKMPINTGFWVEELDMSRDPKINEEIIDGKVYQVATLRKIIAYPQKTGKLKIAPLDIDIQAIIRVSNRRVSTGDPLFDHFFNDPFFQTMQSGYERVKKNIKSNPIIIDVSPLAQTNLNFSGGVGNFKFKSSANPLKCKTNDAITLKYTISGSGNLSLIDKIDLNLPEEFESYDPSILDNLNKTQSGVSGSRTFEYIIIPRVEGIIKIPKVEFTYYDINSKEYKTLSSEEYNFEIEKGKSELSVVAKQLSEREVYKNKDINFINTSSIQTISFNFLYFMHPFLYITLGGILVLSILFILIMNKRIKNNKDFINLRYKTARKIAYKRFKKSKQYLYKNQEDEFYNEIAKAIWNYLLDRFKIQKTELSFENVQERLISNNISQKTISNLINLLDSCEFIRFSYGEDKTKMDTLYNDAINIVSEIESEIKK